MLSQHPLIATATCRCLPQPLAPAGECGCGQPSAAARCGCLAAALPRGRAPGRGCHEARAAGCARSKGAGIQGRRPCPRRCCRRHSRGSTSRCKAVGSGRARATPAGVSCCRGPGRREAASLLCCTPRPACAALTLPCCPCPLLLCLPLSGEPCRGFHKSRLASAAREASSQLEWRPARGRGHCLQPLSAQAAPPPLRACPPCLPSPAALQRCCFCSPGGALLLLLTWRGAAADRGRGCSGFRGAGGRRV